MASIKIVTSDKDINNCHSVMCQLRPHIAVEDFLSLVKTQMQQGYRLAYVEQGGAPVACAGYRCSQNLAWGKFLYVDDLITDEGQRSKGYGKLLLEWLRQQARENDCAQLELDSGLQRKDAHRFYEREAMAMTSYHFSSKLYTAAWL